MFKVPRPLNEGNKVTLKGTFSNKDRFTINLLTGEPADYDNIVCQLETNFSSTNDGIILRIIESGDVEVIEGSYMDSRASDMMTGPEFNFEFKFENNGFLSVYEHGSSIETIEMKHDVSTITFLEIDGNVKITALYFEFS